MAKTVIEYLKEVDYDKLNQYKPTQFAIEFVNFIKLVNGSQGEENQTPIMHYKMLDSLVDGNTQVATMCFRGSAKSLALDTPIMTPNGYVPMQDILVGDTVIDRDGKPTKVTHVSEVFNKQTYEFKLSDGSSFVASEDHIHIVQKRTQKAGSVNTWEEFNLTTKELLDKGVLYNRKTTDKNPKGRDLKWFIPLVLEAIDFQSKGFPIDAYTIGVILGDGNIDSTTGMPTITGHKDDIFEVLSHIPYEYQTIYQDKRNANTLSTRLLGLGKLILTHLGSAKHKDKVIPNDLLFGSREERIAILQGLMDTDGTVSPKGLCTFTSTSKSLAYGVSHLVKSLGGYAYIRRKENDYLGYYTVTVSLQNINPFRLKRKADKWKPNNKHKSGSRVAIESITPTNEIKPSKCIAVDSPTQSYLIDNVVITHNTTINAEYLILYLAVFGELPNLGNINVAIYVTDSIDNGVKSTRKNIEHRWENSEFLQKYIPSIKFTDIRWEFTNKDAKKFVVKAYGAKSGVRGVKEQGKRPQLAILDDLVSDDDARSPTVLESIKATVHEAVINALHPTRQKIIWLGTPFNANDPLYEAIQSGAWTVNAYPICEKFPCSKEEFKGAWEDRFSYDYVKLRYDSAVAVGRVAGFYQELMLQIMGDDERLILDEDIQWYHSYHLMDKKDNFNFYITTDFATSEKESADYSFISVWAVNHKGFYFWIDGICARQTMDKNIDDLFRLVRQYNPISVGVEVSGQQGGFIAWIQREMFNRNVFFTLASNSKDGTLGLKPNNNKLERFNMVVPDFKLKRFYFPHDKKHTIPMKELMLELQQASVGGFKSKHDDGLDTISQLAMMSIWTPSQEADVRQDLIWGNDYHEDNYVSSYIV